jgi:hypothetical protein
MNYAQDWLQSDEWLEKVMIRTAIFIARPVPVKQARAKIEAGKQHV